MDRTPEELAEVQRVHDVLSKAMDREIWQIAELMVGKRDDQLFGETEFALRDKVLRMGAQALQATVNDRKKGGTWAAAMFAQTAAETRVSSVGGRGPS
jgi:pseudouridine-5'-phosphate glycosidase